MTTCIVNYEAGNLGSVLRALYAVGCEALVADVPEALDGAGRIILPGVGNFRDAMERLWAMGWVPKLKQLVQQGNCPLLGICVGMQVLAQGGTESGDPGQPTPGLGLIDGTVQRLDALGSPLRVPQQGWNSLDPCHAPHPLLRHIPGGTDVYFSNSYALPAGARDVLATVNYGVPIAAAVASGSVMGVQFHPEKSSKAGLQVLRNFLAYTC